MPIQSMYQHTSLPPWFEGQQQRLGEAAEALRMSAYQPYTRARLAPYLNQDIEAAQELARQSGGHLPYLEESRQLANAGGSGEFTGENVDRYMNPYQQKVIDSLIENSGKAFREQYLPALRREFIASGNYGGTQHAQQAERLQAEHERALNDQINKSLYEGYGHAGKMFESAKARQIEAAPHIRELGPLHQAGRIGDITALQAVGEGQRGYEQSKKDIEYQDFMRQQAYPWEAIQHQTGVVTGMQQPANMYRSETTGAPGGSSLNTWGQLGALAGNIYGTRMAYGRKSGGAIKAKPKGLSRLSLSEGTFARKPKTGGSKGVKHVKNKDKKVYGGSR